MRRGVRKRDDEEESPAVSLWRRLGAFTIIVLSAAGAAYFMRAGAPDVAADATPCRCVAFRLDDVVDADPGDLQFRLIDLFVQRGVPLTVGIIGARIGDDAGTTAFLRERASAATIEIANHGWEHEDFAVLDRAGQRRLLERTNGRVSRALGVVPRVFIPPFNRFNEHTAAAVFDAGMTHLSSMYPIDSPPYRHGEEAVVRIPAVSATGDYVEGTGAGWRRWPPEKTLQFIEDGLGRVGFAVVMLHAREFRDDAQAPDEQAISDLAAIVDTVREAGVEFRLLSGIARPSSRP